MRFSLRHRSASITRVAILWAGFVFSIWSGGAAEESDGKPEAKETVTRVWQVPWDLATRERKENSDRFAPETHDPPRVPLVESFGLVIPALGPVPPLDVREVLKRSGINFQEGEMALFSNDAGEEALLFVRATRKNIEAIDQVLLGYEMLTRHVEATFTLHRRLPDGKAEELVRRSLLSRAGQRAKFQRHYGGKLVEEEEFESSAGEDGVTVDLNAAAAFHLDGGLIKVATQVQVREGDERLLYSSPDKSGKEKLEVAVSVKRMGLATTEVPDSPQANLSKLAAQIDAQIRALPAKLPPHERRGGLYFLPGLRWMAPSQPDGEHVSWERLPEKKMKVAVPVMDSPVLTNVFEYLKQTGVALQEGDSAWFVHGSGMLYVNAGEAAQDRLSQYEMDEPVPVCPFEVTFSSWQEEAGTGKREEFAPRSLLAWGAQKSRSGFGSSPEMAETIEVEANGEAENPQAGVSFSLTSFRMGDERWSVNTKTTTTTDGSLPVVIASGRAADSGGAVKRLAVSCRMRPGEKRELLRDPDKKREAITTIEEALKGPLAPEEPKPPLPAQEYRLWSVPDFPPDHVISDREEKPPKPRVYPHVIPALGIAPPRDVREIFESMGVTFQKGDAALCSMIRNESTLLFVKASPEMLELLDAILAPMGSSVVQAEATFQLRRRLADGASTDLIRRTVLCRGGQTATFSRQRAEKALEEVVLELFVGEDGVTVQLESVLGYYLEGDRLEVKGQSLLRGGDAGMLLYRGPDKVPGAMLEVTAAAKVGYRTSPTDGNEPPHDQLPLARGINALVTAYETGTPAPADGPPNPKAELFHILEAGSLFDVRGGHGAGEAPKIEGRKVEVALPEAGTVTFTNATPRLKTRLALVEGDETWYSEETGLLFIRAGETGRVTALGFVSRGRPPERARQLEVRFASSRDEGGGQSRLNFPARALLVRGGQRSKGTTEILPGKTETVEVEATVSFTGNIADINVALTDLQMGDEVWNVQQQALVSTDGLSPVSLVSGMSADAGGRMTRLTTSTRLRYDGWTELVLDLKRKEAAIAAIENAIGKK